MQQLARNARGTASIHATPVHFAFHTHQFALADRAGTRKHYVLCAARVQFVLDHFRDLRNDVTAALDGHVVANARAETFYLVWVVQRGALHCRAANVDGSERGHRCYFACASHLKENVFQLCDSCPRRELICDRPSWRLSGKT